MAEYDDVIVGGGSAGVALATRLSEDPSRQVLLIEAGPDVQGVSEPDYLQDQMRFSSRLTEWGVDATFVPGMTMNYPQGRKLGGGSAVNGAFAVRGLPDDYARWAAAAGDEWSWPNMLRVLNRLESDQNFSGEFHGKDGPIPVVRWSKDELLPMQQSFLAAVNSHGIPWVDDMNAPDASGIGAIPMNRQDGVRMSTALTYLPPARDRDNLTIRTEIEVQRVLFEGNRATGIEFVADGKTEQIHGSRVILSAGALQSPTVLLHSGIGPAEHLAAMGIDCVVNLSGVGQNLMDHQGAAVFLVPKGQLDPTDARVCQLGARYSSESGLAKDDMWLSMWTSWELDEFPDLRNMLGVPAISAVIVGIHDPKGRGEVRLRSSDPSVRPEVDFKMLSHPDDLSRMVEGLQVAVSLASSDAFKADYTGIGLLDPAIVEDRAAMEEYLKPSVGGWYHAAGTCRMGNDPDEGAVVDGQLRVHGVDGLYVADASVMPTVVRSPTNLSSIAIGERLAEMLRAN